MPSAQHVYNAIHGAWRLALMDPGGMRHFEISIDGFWRSFFAAVLALPLYAVFVMLHLQEAPAQVAPVGAEPAAVVLVRLGGLVVSWAVFVVAATFITRQLSLSARYVPYIIAYNWAVVIQISVLLLVTLLHRIGILPEGLIAVLALMVSLAILFYQWFIARVALQTSGLIATAMVVLDLIITFSVDWGGSLLL